MERDQNGNFVGEGVLEGPQRSTNPPRFSILLRKQLVRPNWYSGAITPLDADGFDQLFQASTPTFFISDTNKRIEISVEGMHPASAIEITWRRPQE